MRKLNIHLTLDERATNYCIKVNEGLQKITISRIIFGKDSSLIPHLSLIIGDLYENYTYQDVTTAIQSVASRFTRLQLSVGHPYLTGRWVFSNVKGERLLELRKAVREKLGEKYLRPQPVSDVPHITLGYVEQHHNEVRSYLDGINDDFNFYSTSIEISDGGPQGTCINSLSTIPLE